MITANEARELSKNNETIANTKKLAESVLDVISDKITACATEAENKYVISSGSVYEMLYPGYEKEYRDKINASLLREIVRKELTNNGFMFKESSNSIGGYYIIVAW